VSERSPLSPSQRQLREDQILGRLSRRFGLSREALKDRLHELRSQRGRPAAPAAADEPAPIAVGRLPAWDREVIEVLVGVPESVGLVVREVETADLETAAGRTVLDAARHLHDAGKPVALSGLLLAIDDPALQSLLVAIDDGTAGRGALDAAERLHHFEDALRRRSAQRQAHASVLALKSSRLDPGSEAALLERLVAQRRAAQGMSDPKDG